MDDNKLDKAEENVNVKGRVFDGRAGFKWEAVEGEKDGAQLLELMKTELEAKTSSLTAPEKTPEPEPKPEVAPEPVHEKEVKPEKEAKPVKPPKPKREKKPKPPKAPKPKREKKPIRALFVALILIAIAYFAYEYVAGIKVTVSYATFDGTTEIGYRTKASNTGDLFDELCKTKNLKGGEINISPDDVLMQGSKTKLKRYMVIDIRQSKEGLASVKGEDETIRMFPGNVKEILDHNGIKYDDDDEIIPSLSRAAKSDTRIEVNEVHYTEEEKTEKVKADDKLVLDPTLASGDSEYIEGKDGEGVYVYKTKYINDKEDSVEKTMKEWVEKSEDNVLRLGTSATGNKGEYSSDKSLDIDVSAYTAEAGTRGSTGKLLHIGSCAVDPEVIAPGSELWIEGYGYAYANDTVNESDKSDIKVFVSSNKQLEAWENTECRVYVLRSVKE